MSTSTNHKRLEDFATEYLVERGFKPKEIHKDYPLKIGRQQMYIDVVGIKEDNSCSIAIECGNCSADKIIKLQPFFNEVKIFPYGILESLKGLDKNTEIKRLKRENEELEKQLERIKKQKEEEQKNKRFLLAILVYYGVLPEHWVQRHQIQETLNIVTYALEFSKKYGKVEAQLRLKQLVDKMKEHRKEK